MASFTWPPNLSGSPSYPLLAPNGSAAAPSYSFGGGTGGAGTGFYGAGTNQIGFATAGTNVGSINASGLWTLGTSGGTQTHVINGTLRTTVAFKFPNGALGTPALTFTNSATQGLYLNGNSDISISCLSSNDIQTSTATANVFSFNVRSVSGRGPYFLLAEAGVANRWAIGSDAASAVLNFRSGDATGTVRASMDGSGNVVIGTAAISTSATDGFLYIPTCAGPPTGVPTAKTGRGPLVYDSTNNKLYFYSGSWRGVTLA